MKKLVLLFAACLMVIGYEKDVIDQMEAYYTESMGLQSVTIDSVKTFSNKVNNYVTQLQKKKNITCTLRYRQISSLRRFG